MSRIDELGEELEHERAENRRLLSYIQACRIRFGDAAVNQAIMELVPKHRDKPRDVDWKGVLDQWFAAHSKT